MKIIHIVGARPNFMKVAPIIDAIREHNARGEGPAIEQTLVHTGQHYDHAMSELFFNQLGMPKPDINLEIGSGSHGQQTGRIMEEFEKVLQQYSPDLVLVVGDVNSTMACTIDAKKMNIPVAHVEAGLRSRDMTMPEEVNRLVTDCLSDLLFTTDHIANENLKKEGVPEQRIFLVGNVMIDTLVKHRDNALRLSTLEQFGLRDESGEVRPYAVMTLHRPGNVDDEDVFRGIAEAALEIGRKMPVVFPVHPRTRGRIKQYGLQDTLVPERGILLLEPLGYLDFLNLMANSAVILSDSGGIQEESTILGIPCLTLRPNTERPITIEKGTNLLVGNRKEDILAAFNKVNKGKVSASVPELWDGEAAKRIVKVLIKWFYG